MQLINEASLNRATLVAEADLAPAFQGFSHAGYSNPIAEGVDGVLNALPRPTWIVRGDLAVDHANRQAREIMSAGQFVKANMNGLMAIGDLDHQALKSAVAAASHGGSRLWIAAMSVQGRLRRAVLHVTPVASAEPYATTWPHARAMLSLELPWPANVTVLWHSRLASHYRLTPAEMRVLERLSAGLTPREIADEAQVSYATTRTHLRALFDKTGCRRQTELVRLAIGH